MLFPQWANSLLQSYMCIMVEIWSTCMLSANKIDLIIIGTKQSSTEQAHKPLSTFKLFDSGTSLCST